MLEKSHVVLAGKAQTFYYLASFRTSRDVLEGGRDPEENAIDDIKFA